jgi:hypothetical protein
MGLARNDNERKKVMLRAISCIRKTSLNNLSRAASATFVRFMVLSPFLLHQLARPVAPSRSLPITVRRAPHPLSISTPSNKAILLHLPPIPPLEILKYSLYIYPAEDQRLAARL